MARTIQAQSVNPMSRREWWLLAAALLAFVAVATDSLRQKSGTFDEPAHIVSGYAGLALGDYRLSTDHPPLLKKLAAWPLWLSGARFHEDDDAWRQRRLWSVGRSFVYRWNDAVVLLSRARAPMLGLGATLGVAVFFWARRLWGRAAGWLALVVCLASPDVLAHTRLVTTDVGLTLFVFLAVGAFERLTEVVTWPRVLGLGTAVGAALASKYSGLVLVPTLVVLVLIAARNRDRWELHLAPFAPRRPRGVSPRLLAWGALLALATLVAAATIWAAYGFQSELSRDPQALAEVDWSRVAADPGPIGAFESLLREAGLLPEAWHYGFLRFLKHSGPRQAFLHGKISTEGFPGFFLVSFLLKTPLPFLALLAIGLAVRVERRARGLAVACVAVPVLVYAALTLTRGLTIGHRHLLPLYPFLFLMAGRAAAWAWPASPGTLALRGRQLVVCFLAAGCLLVPLQVHPHYLAYFNIFAGGPGGGHRWLVDSSLDWGQDLPALAEWQRRSGIAPVRLAYFGTAEPASYGLDVTWLPSYYPPPSQHVERRVHRGDVVAVSATLLRGLYLPSEDAALLARFRDLEPIGSAGHSILIYQADFDWP